MGNEKIKKIYAREIIDSRGNPTLEVEIFGTLGSHGRASVPSGASTGEHEAVELRDGDSGRYGGKGVLRAVDNVQRVIAPELIGLPLCEQTMIDHLMCRLDGTSNKSNLGANSILGVSLALAHTAANSVGVPLYRYIGGVGACVLPVPMMNIINGGSHSDAPISFQEFMIRPVGAGSLSDAVRMGSEVFHSLKSQLKRRGLSTAVGDEGGFAPDFSGTDDAIESILMAIEEAGYKTGEDITLALDCASSEFYDKESGVYDYSIFEGVGGHKRNSVEQVDYLCDLVGRYPIDSIEDGMDQNDWDGWRLLTERLGGVCQIVGDDLFVTNTEYLERGILLGAGNSILIKVNQIGTLSETLAAISLAHRSGMRAVVSHRSGETEDTTISHISVGTNCGQIKCGSLSRSERISKYNELFRIEEGLGVSGRYGFLYF